VLKNRLKSLLELYDTQAFYPFRARVLGFYTLYVRDQEDLRSRIRELCDILGLEAEESVQLDDGSKLWRLL